MKRGKDEEKSMRPMFPRLHVNDTEKGGPRAPPRNKMALYEQLSIPSQRFNGPNSNLGTVVRQEQKKKQEEDDFRVPIFDQQSETSQNHDGNHQNRESNLNESFSGRLAHIQNAKQKVQKENSQDFVKSASNHSTRQNNKAPLKETNESLNFVRRNALNIVNLRDYPQADKTLWGESVMNEGISIPIQENVLISPNDDINGDAVSETSMVDSICGVDISPDDVVGIIGQKHFWKARRAIVNQQRVFAVQVFELHRLIKVQRLIAGSPHLLVEDLAKPAKPSPVKKIPFEYVMKSIPVMANKHKDDRETEFSAENAIGKASLSSVQNGSQNPSCRPFSGTNTLPFSDPKMGSWSFNHMPGHQWLIPVMSPSEGLVYKPYPGPGFAGPVYGSGPTPVTGPNNFANYGVPPSNHRYEGSTGVHPFAPSPASLGYFPPYNMPTVNPSVPSSKWEQTNPFNQSSNNVPIDKNKFDASKDSEVQVSTASSRSDRTRGRNALNLFPTSLPPAEPTQVIRVVPHNARSATASVARIFQSIQEERKQ